MGSALLNMAGDLEFAGVENDFVPARSAENRDSRRSEWTSTAGVQADDLRQQVAEKVRAHRSRRDAAGTQATTEPVRASADGRSARIAAAVAERYARTPSYREMLAAEAERAIQQARAAAEVAAQNARAIAVAQQRLLEQYDECALREQTELAQRESDATTCDAIGTVVESARNAVVEQQLWPDLAEFAAGGEQARKARPSGKLARRTEGRGAAASEAKSETYSAGGLTVRLYEDSVRANPLSSRPGMTTVRGSGRGELGFNGDQSAAEAMALDEEIAFRQAPVFEEPAGPPVALPANLIEFPRQLVAARKARPRYAEGPLRDEMEAAPADGQLRIFEVDPAQISTSPEEVETQAAQWTSLWLDARAQGERLEAAKEEAEAVTLPAAVFEPASLGRRAAAGAINLAIVACGLLAFAAVAAAVAGHGTAGHASAARFVLAQWKMMVTCAAVSGAFLLMLYHGLFFWFSFATPGMRCVRVALCTFEDENPTRRNVRRRMAATMLSACSLGMGYAWAALDEERLTWHDRMSRMYLRRY